ncbi:MAG: sporulation protein YqfD [Butyrivibrio sp.]|nr:sporulation protein YqfD [Acetatifactor muris]MCM1560517.1 sporulation protein YqfD [Butyrivibrio sp.]
MIEFLKYIRGYLRIRVSGFSPERFMNLCSNKGILLWKIVREGDVYYMNINLKGFRALRPIVRKTGTRVAILERYGLPFFLPKLLKRKVFVGGLLLAVAFWMWSSLFIWDIELSGNYQITDDMFQSFLKENEVIVGMKKGELDIESLEKEIRRSFPEVTWASARLSGTKLLIDIKENDAPIITEQEKTEAGSNLVSSCGGTVVSIIVRSGVPMVNAGDTIEAGAVLVEGRVPVYNDDATVREYIYVDADADIILEHTREFSDRLPLDYIKKEYTGREKDTRYLRLGDNQLKLPQDRPFLIYDSVIRESRPLIFEKLSIPVYMGSCTYREYMNVEYKYSREEAEEQLGEKLITFLTSLEEKGVQIIEKDVKIDISDNFWVLSGLFLVREPVGDSVAVEKIIIGETEADE